MFEQVKKQLKKYQPYLNELQDVRVLGLILFAVVVLLVSWSGVKAIDTNYQLQKQISALAQQNTLQELTDKNLELENGYYKTDQYLELSARQNFGLAKPGETELIVPKNVALAHTIALSNNDSKPASSAQPAWQQHFQSWVDFFMHRQPER
jgi:cell division protein FtsB